jgi:hypothetical protein
MAGRAERGQCALLEAIGRASVPAASWVGALDLPGGIVPVAISRRPAGRIGAGRRACPGARDGATMIDSMRSA